MQYELRFPAKEHPKYEAGAAWSRWLERDYVAKTWDEFRLMSAGLMLVLLASLVSLFGTISDVMQYRARVADWNRAYIASKIVQYQEPRPDFVDYYNSNPWLRREGRLSSHVRESRRTRPFSGTQLAFFEAFPSSGAGTTTACSTTAPTGAKGETLTFTRAGSATCTKTASGGLATTGIADGDLVVLSANQPRVEYDSAGTLGLRVESAQTNVLLRSQEFDNAAWTNVAGITVTPNVGTAPDGTATADRVQINGAFSILRQTITCSFGSVFVKSYQGAGAQSFWLGDGSTQAGLCSSVEGSWTRCLVAGAGTPFFDIGTNTGNTAIGAGGVIANADVLLWGAGCEAGASATSYIPTTNAAVARGAELAYFPTSATWTAGSMAASVNYLVGAADWAWISLDETLTFRTMLYATSADQVQMYANAAIRATTTTSPPQARVAGYWGSAGTGACNSGVCVTGVAASGLGSPNSITLGTYARDVTKLKASIISRICLDPDPTRCR
jgi:hypothetical protein